MIWRSGGLATILERGGDVYVLAFAGPHRLQPLALSGPAAVIFTALEVPQDRPALHACLAAAYPDRLEDEVASVSAETLEVLLEAGLISESA